MVSHLGYGHEFALSHQSQLVVLALVITQRILSRLDQMDIQNRPYYMFNYLDGEAFWAHEHAEFTRKPAACTV